MSKGKCADCGKPSGTFYRCKACRDKYNEYQRSDKVREYQRKTKARVYAENRAKGLCSCGRETTPGFKTCKKCRDRSAKGIAKWLSTTDGRKSYNLKEAKRRAKIRDAVIDAYGGKCACCGEANKGFLTLDHVNSDGAAHRKAMGNVKATFKVYEWARRNKYPPSLQVLCFNCNCGRHYRGNGICPHKIIELGSARK